MRVLHVTYQHTADDARILHKECRSIAEAGHETHLIAPPPSPKQLFNVCYHALSPKGTQSKPQQLRTWFAEIEKYLSVIDPDIVHLHDTMLLTAAQELKRRYTNIRFVYDVHEDHPRQIRALTHLSWPRRTAQAMYYAHIEKKARKWIDLFVAATPSIAKLYPSDRTIIVRNLPRLDEFTPASTANRPNSIIYVGGLTRSRGVIEMIDAVDMMKSADVKLILAGKFDSDDTKRAAQSRPGRSRVDFRGWVDHANVPTLLHEASAGIVALHPKSNYLDAWPVKLFEYMAAGLPFVASDFPAWRSMLGEERCGLFVNPQHAPAIAEACDYLLQNPEEARAMSAAGRALIETKFNWENEARSLLEAYAQLQQYHVH